MLIDSIIVSFFQLLDICLHNIQKFGASIMFFDFPRNAENKNRSNQNQGLKSLLILLY